MAESFKGWNAEFLAVLGKEVKHMNLPLVAWYNAKLTPTEAVEALNALVSVGASLQALQSLEVEHFSQYGCHVSVSRQPTEAELELLETYLSGNGTVIVAIGFFLQDGDRFVASYKCGLNKGKKKS